MTAIVERLSVSPRVERIGDAELWLGDCREIAPTLPRADALISDPPYGVSERTNRKAAGRSNLAECNDFPPVFGDDEPFDPAVWIAMSDKVILWGANHYCSRMPGSPTWLVWDKRDGVPSNDNADCEMAWSNVGGPARLIRHLWSGMIKASEKDERRVHPTQKPIEVMRWCVQQARLKPASSIMDPFMGAGSSGIAALSLGHRFTGIEIDPRYFDTACRRIEREASQGRLL